MSICDLILCQREMLYRGFSYSSDHCLHEQSPELVKFHYYANFQPDTNLLTIRMCTE